MMRFVGLLLMSMAFVGLMAATPTPSHAAGRAGYRHPQLAAFAPHAQTPGTNPITDTANQAAMIATVRSLMFWMFALGAVGVVVFVASYALQGVAPQLFQYRDYVRNMAAFFLIAPLAVNWMLAQAAAPPAP